MVQAIFEELDFQPTRLGDISLRRRSEPRLDNEIIFEVKLGDEFLMSSLFVEAEEQLSTLAKELRSKEQQTNSTKKKKTRKRRARLDPFFAALCAERGLKRKTKKGPENETKKRQINKKTQNKQQKNK